MLPVVFLVALSSVACVLRAETPAAPAPLVSGLDRANFDPAVRPQDDLFRAVNGTWLAKTKIPADRSDYGAFAVLTDQAEKDLRRSSRTCAAKDNAPGSERQKIGDLYASYMDEERADRLGIEPIAGNARGDRPDRDQGRPRPRVG